MTNALKFRAKNITVFKNCTYPVLYFSTRSLIAAFLNISGTINPTPLKPFGNADPLPKIIPYILIK
jgi:hypothetical protein